LLATFCGNLIPYEPGVCIHAAFLLANVPLAEIDGTVVAEITLQDGEGIDFILDDGDAAEATPEEMEAQKVAFWQNWARQSTYRGRWREM
ncbi:hypothetical protein ACC760_38220, partial [Rhizobium ruizarguesonis]